MANKGQPSPLKGKPRGTRLIAECHPDRPHYGNGLCQSCWKKPRREHYKREHGITAEEYDRRIREQNNLCALCGDPFVFGNYRHPLAPNLDHNHKTGRHRGIIHGQCNRLLGQANDDPVRLAQAIEYLQRDIDWKQIGNFHALMSLGY